MHLVDVHCHLNHTKYDLDRTQVVNESVAAGLSKIVVNGLNPPTNDISLAMAKKTPQVMAATGIYPIDAINHILPQDFKLDILRFDVDEEIARIDRWAKEGLISAVGECGLDGYWVGEETFKEQERVFCELISIAKKNSLPIIIHSRKLERRCFDIMIEQQYFRADFHCYGGKSKLAVRMAEEHGFYFSIPANARRNESFAKMLRTLPESSILTETDSPFLCPERSGRNHPKNVGGTIDFLAELREISVNDARELVWNNFNRLFDNDC